MLTLAGVNLEMSLDERLNQSPTSSLSSTSRSAGFPRHRTPRVSITITPSLTNQQVLLLAFSIRSQAKIPRSESKRRGRPESSWTKCTSLKLLSSSLHHEFVAVVVAMVAVSGEKVYGEGKEDLWMR
ncbi:hypothetical protein Droror1_Dr00018574 [Drosera rotundifolia]